MLCEARYIIESGFKVLRCGVYRYKGTGCSVDISAIHSLNSTGRETIQSRKPCLFGRLCAVAEQEKLLTTLEIQHILSLIYYVHIFGIACHTIHAADGRKGIYVIEENDYGTGVSYDDSLLKFMQ